MMKLKILLGNIFVFLFNFLAFADDFEGDDNLPPPPEVEGARAVPIDMYEMILLSVAIMLIIVYYFYSKKVIK